jgi:hypothetical protein
MNWDDRLHAERARKDVARPNYLAIFCDPVQIAQKNGWNCGYSYRNRLEKKKFAPDLPVGVSEKR